MIINNDVSPSCLESQRSSQVKANAKTLADTLMGKGHKLASDGALPSKS
jgi:glycine/serine hydroxymethyltransferase